MTEGAYSSPALSEGTLYFGSDGVSANHLFALRSADGSVRWKFPVEKQIFSTPAVEAGTVYFHARDDHVYAVKADDGALRWKVPAPAPQAEFSVFSDMAKSSPAVARGRVYVGVGKELLALGAADGEVLWRSAAGARVDSSPLVVGATVYVGSDDRNLYGFDAVSGAQTWMFETGGRVSIPPSAGEGLVLFGSNDGRLYAFEAAR